MKWLWRNRSQAIWLAWIVFGLVYELFAVLMEKRTRDEPLTRVYRDRWMRLPKVGKLIQLAWFLLFAWWMVHWAVGGSNPVSW